MAPRMKTDSIMIISLFIYHLHTYKTALGMFISSDPDL